MVHCDDPIWCDGLEMMLGKHITRLDYDNCFYSKSVFDIPLALR